MKQPKLRKDVRETYKKALALGWELKRQTANGYPVMVIPDHPEIAPVVIPKTPSDNRSLDNCLAALKRGAKEAFGPTE